MVSGDTGGGTLRERRLRQTRRDIRQAALRLFDEQGYAATTVEQIAAAGGVAPRTFFRYFATKSDLLFEAEGGTAARLRELLAGASPGPPLEQVREALLRLQFDEVTDEAGARIVARLVAAEPTLLARNEQLAAELEEAVATHLTTTAGLAVEHAQLVAGALFGALRTARRLAVRSPAGPVELVNAAYDLIAPLLATPVSRPDQH